MCFGLTKNRGRCWPNKQIKMGPITFKNLQDPRKTHYSKEAANAV